MEKHSEVQSQINNNYYSHVAENLHNDNTNEILNSLVNDLPIKEKPKIEDTSLFNKINGSQKLSEKRECMKFGLNCVFFTPQSINKIENLFKEGNVYTLSSNDSKIVFPVYTLDACHRILGENKEVYNWCLIQETKNPLLVEGKKVSLEVFVLLTITEKKIHAYMHNTGYMLTSKKQYMKGVINPDNNVQVFPDDFLSQFGNTVMYEQVIPSIKGILRNGLNLSKPTIEKYNRLQFKKGFKCYDLFQFKFDVDMNYKAHLIEAFNRPISRIPDYHNSVITEILEAVSGEKPTGFGMIFEEGIYIEPEYIEKKKKKGVARSRKKKKPETYVEKIKDDTESKIKKAYDSLGDFKMVLFALFIILLFVLWVNYY